MRNYPQTLKRKLLDTICQIREDLSKYTVDPKRDFTRNRKLPFVGVDIGSEQHYARAFDWRGLEVTRKVFHFSNSLEGYQRFEKWVAKLQESRQKDVVFVGCEPTGHYWFTFGDYVQTRGMKLVFVNPYHVKQSKEMDDNSPKKTDQKDPSRTRTHTPCGTGT